jgi:serine/threonine protein kinase
VVDHPDGSVTASGILLFPEGFEMAGRYRLVEVLGTGGTSVVYRARDERLHRDVAVKVVSDRDGEFAGRLRSEARILARLRHPSIVQVYDVAEHDSRPFLVTELAQGPTLRHLLHDGALSPADVARVGADVASALSAAHAVGVIHRDLKPSNVIVPQTGPARLVDFGIAHMQDTTRFTQPGTIVGTVAYLAPEQLREGPVTPACDVYSLGLVLLEALTGRQSFGGTLQETVAARLLAPPEIPLEAPDPWPRVLGRMTRVDPAMRPAAADASRDLATLRDGESAALEEPTVRVARSAASVRDPRDDRATAVLPAPAGTPRRRAIVVLLGLVLALSLVGVLAAATADRDGGSVPDESSTTVTTAAATVTSSPATVRPTTTVPPTTPPPTTAPADDAGEDPGRGDRNGGDRDGRDRGSGRQDRRERD